VGFVLAERVSDACVVVAEPMLSWCRRLPLDPVLVAISELLPKIQESQPRAGAPSQKVFNILKGASLVDVLPPAPPIMPRRFQVSGDSSAFAFALASPSSAPAPSFFSRPHHAFVQKCFARRETCGASSSLTDSEAPDQMMIGCVMSIRRH
jgi:hypothetical protein